MKPANAPLLNQPHKPHPEITCEREYSDLRHCQTAEPKSQRLSSLSCE